MKIIAHLYVHNFHIAAALADKPDLTGTPLAVVKNKTVIDASPDALAQGVVPGLTRRQALQCCPELNLIDYTEHIYRERTLELSRRCYDLSPRVERPSENEVFLDLSSSKPPSLRSLKSLVTQLVPRLGSFATVSLAPSRLLAKAATLMRVSADIARPAGCSSACAGSPAVPGLVTRDFGQFNLGVVKTEAADDFASRLPLDVLWPLSEDVKKRLKTLGYNISGDIAKIPPTLLSRQFGPLAPLILELSQGIDTSKVPVFRPPDKLVYHCRSEYTKRSQLEETIRLAALSLGKDLQQKGSGYRELTLSLFQEDNVVKIKTSAFTKGKQDTCSLYHDGMNLLKKTKVNAPVTEITLTAGNLTKACHTQMAIFEDPGTYSTRSSDHKEKMAQVIKNLSAKYATGIISMGSELSISRREQMLMFVDPFRS